MQNIQGVLFKKLTLCQNLTFADIFFYFRPKIMMDQKNLYNFCIYHFLIPLQINEIDGGAKYNQTPGPKLICVKTYLNWTILFILENRQATTNGLGTSSFQKSGC